MPVILGKSGVNRELKEIYLGNSGINRKEKELHLGKSGVNKQIYTSNVDIKDITHTSIINFAPILINEIIFTIDSSSVFNWSSKVSSDRSNLGIIITMESGIKISIADTAWQTYDSEYGEYIIVTEPYYSMPNYGGIGTGRGYTVMRNFRMVYTTDNILIYFTGRPISGSRGITYAECGINKNDKAVSCQMFYKYITNPKASLIIR